MRLGCDEQANQLLEHGFRVEIFLRLIDYQRTIVMIVEGQIEQEEDNPPRAWR